MNATSGTDAAHRPPLRSEFTTTDAQEAWAFLERAYGTNLRMSGPEDGHLLRHVRTDAGLFSMDDIVLPAGLTTDADPLGTLVLVQLDAGRIERQCARVCERFAPGDVLATAQPDLPYRMQIQDVKVRAVTLDPLLLARVANTTPTDRPRPTRFSSLQPASTASAHLWKRTVDYLSRELLTNPAAAAQPLVIGNAAQLLAAVTLTAFPTTAPAESTAQDRIDTTPAVLRRAIGFIESHAHTDIALADIAAASRVTPRALQYAFRRHLDTTPLGYLRQVRLDHAHSDLLTADPTRGDTVTGIAARWGFLHPGRFAALHRAAYGQSPRDALRA